MKSISNITPLILTLTILALIGVGYADLNIHKLKTTNSNHVADILPQSEKNCSPLDNSKPNQTAQAQIISLAKQMAQYNNILHNTNNPQFQTLTNQYDSLIDQYDSCTIVNN